MNEDHDDKTIQVFVSRIEDEVKKKIFLPF